MIYMAYSMKGAVQKAKKIQSKVANTTIGEAAAGVSRVFTKFAAYTYAGPGKNYTGWPPKK